MNIFKKDKTLQDLQSQIIDLNEQIKDKDKVIESIEHDLKIIASTHPDYLVIDGNSQQIKCDRKNVIVFGNRHILEVSGEEVSVMFMSGSCYNIVVHSDKTKVSVTFAKKSWDNIINTKPSGERK